MPKLFLTHPVVEEETHTSFLTNDVFFFMDESSFLKNASSGLWSEWGYDTSK